MTTGKTSGGTGKAAIYLIAGDDEFAVGNAGREIAASLVAPGEEAFGLEIIEAAADNVEQAISALRKCSEALRTGSFLGGNKVVWLRDASFLAGSTTGKSADVKATLDSLTELVKAGLMAGHTLIVTAPQIDERTAFFQSCKKAGAEISKFMVPEKSWEAEKQAAREAAAEMKKAGLSLPDDAMDAFVRKVGTDPRQIANEVEKLSLYLGGRRTVRMDDIVTIVSPCREIPVWDLAEAMAGRDLAGALRIIRRLLFQGEQPVGLIIGLEKRIGELIVLHEAMGRGWLKLTGNSNYITATWQATPEIDEAMSNFGRDDPRKMNSYRCAKLASQARTFSLAELRRWRAQVVRAHEQLVTTSVSDSMLLEILLVRLIGVSGNRPTSRPVRY